MHFTPLDFVFQGIGFVGHCMLLRVLIVRRFVRQFPRFTAFVIFQLVRTLVLVPILVMTARWTYFYAYHVFNVLDVVFTFAVIYGIGSSVFKPFGVWEPDVRSKVLLLMAGGVVVAAILTAQINPPATLLVHKITIRGEFFVAILMLELFAIILLVSSSAGLAWRHHVRNMADAFAVYSIALALVEWAHSYYGARNPVYAYFSRARVVIYLLALCYWNVTLWFPEPSRTEVTTELREAIFSLRSQLTNSISRIRHTKK